MSPKTLKTDRSSSSQGPAVRRVLCDQQAARLLLLQPSPGSSFSETQESRRQLITSLEVAALPDAPGERALACSPSCAYGSGFRPTPHLGHPGAIISTPTIGNVLMALPQKMPALGESVGKWGHVLPFRIKIKIK